MAQIFVRDESSVWSALKLTDDVYRLTLPSSQDTPGRKSLQPFHHLRHAYATLQIEAGEELVNVSKMLGHASLSTTADLYAYLTPQTQRRAAERMDRILAGCL